MPEKNLGLPDVPAVRRSSPGDPIRALPLLSVLPAHGQSAKQSFHLSVLVPVYNERHVVEASLRRLLALEHQIIESLEVIVVDDCSTDGSLEILERIAASDPRVTLLKHERNQGKGAALPWVASSSLAAGATLSFRHLSGALPELFATKALHAVK